MELLACRARAALSRLSAQARPCEPSLARPLRAAHCAWQMVSRPTPVSPHKGRSSGGSNSSTSASSASMAGSPHTVQATGDRPLVVAGPPEG